MEGTLKGQVVVEKIFVYFEILNYVRITLKKYPCSLLWVIHRFGYGLEEDEDPHLPYGASFEGNIRICSNKCSDWSFFTESTLEIREEK